MKAGRPDGSISKLPPPVGGMERSFPNSTPLAKNRGRLKVACQHCGTQFMRAAAELARQANHYCSKACFGLATRNRVLMRCTTCERVVETTAKSAPVVCSEECLILGRKLRRHHDKTGVYQKAVAVRESGGSLSAVALACGVASKQGAVGILKCASEQKELLARRDQLRGDALTLPVITRKCAP